MPSPHLRRRGGVTLWALLVLPVLLVAAAVTINAGWLSAATQEMRTAADAGSLAAARVLVSDEWLRDGRPGVASLLDSVRVTAADFGSRNAVLGRPLAVLPDDPTSPDVTVGAYDPTGAGLFTPLPDSGGSPPTLDQADSVLVTARRVRRRSTAIPLIFGPLVLATQVDANVGIVGRLDRDVYGFRALASRNIPLVPIAVFSDPDGSAIPSWDNRIVGRNGPDLNGDGIPEMECVLGLNPPGLPIPSNVCLLTIGAGGNRPAQIRDGIPLADVADRGGRLELDATTQELPLPGIGRGPTRLGTAYAQLVAALRHLRDTDAVRVWPLCLNPNPLPLGSGTARVNAFVAARVLEVTEPSTAVGPLRFRLQPAMLHEPQALTDRDRSGAAHLVPSPYLGRVRPAR